MSEEAAAAEPPLHLVPVDEPVGDAACWLGQLCPECGAMNEGPIVAVCWRCGAARDEAD